MDFSEYYNIISEQDYKKALSGCLIDSFKSLTFTYYSLIEIYSKASKKCKLSPIVDEDCHTPPKPLPIFHKLLNNLKIYTDDLEKNAKTLFEKLQLDLEEESGLPASLTGLIDDSIVQRTEVMKNKTQLKGRSNNLIRQLNSIVNSIEGLDEFKQSQLNEKKISKEKSDLAKDIQVLHHLNGKIKYKGNLVNNEYHGIGFLNHYNGNLVYRGSFQNGKIDGKDCEIFHLNGNLKYKGPITDGFYNGQGELYFENGCVKYKGNFKNDKPDQTDAKIYFDNGNVEYEGPIEEGLYTGYGTLAHKNGNIEYEGEFEEGGAHGQECKVCHENGRVKYRGGIDKGLFEGCGVLFSKNGVQEYKGFFKYGKPMKNMKSMIHGIEMLDIQSDDSVSEFSRNSEVFEYALRENHEEGEVQGYQSLLVIKPGPENNKIDGLPLKYDYFEKKDHKIEETMKRTVINQAIQKETLGKSRISKHSGFSSVDNRLIINESSKEKKASIRNNRSKEKLYDLLSPVGNKKKKASTKRSKPKDALSKVLRRDKSKSVVPKKKRAVSPKKRAVSPEKRAVSPKKRAVSPKKRAVSPEKRTVSPRKGTVSPKKRAVSPRKGQSIDSPNKKKTGLAKKLRLHDSSPKIVKSQSQEKVGKPAKGEKYVTAVPFFKDSVEECAMNERDFYQNHGRPDEEEFTKNPIPRIHTRDTSPHKQREEHKIVEYRESIFVDHHHGPSPSRNKETEEDPNQWIKTKEFNMPHRKPTPDSCRPNIAPPPEIEIRGYSNINKQKQPKKKVLPQELNEETLKSYLINLGFTFDKEDTENESWKQLETQLNKCEAGDQASKNRIADLLASRMGWVHNFGSPLKTNRIGGADSKKSVPLLKKLKTSNKNITSRLMNSNPNASTKSVKPKRDLKEPPPVKTNSVKRRIVNRQKSPNKGTAVSGKNTMKILTSLDKRVTPQYGSVKKTNDEVNIDEFELSAVNKDNGPSDTQEVQKGTKMKEVAEEPEVQNVYNRMKTIDMKTDKRKEARSKRLMNVDSENF